MTLASNSRMVSAISLAPATTVSIGPPETLSTGRGSTNCGMALPGNGVCCEEAAGAQLSSKIRTASKDEVARNLDDMDELLSRCVRAPLLPDGVRQQNTFDAGRPSALVSTPAAPGNKPCFGRRPGCGRQCQRQWSPGRNPADEAWRPGQPGTHESTADWICV
jgi:hypothetical protein